MKNYTHNLVVATSVIEHFKKQAKQLKKEQSITHTEALEQVARKIGFDHWHAVTLANKKIRPAEEAYKNGCVLVFDFKGGMDISSNETLINDHWLEMICEKSLFTAYGNKVDVDDPQGRTFKDTLTPDELEEYFRDDSMFIFFRISDSIFKKHSSLEDVLRLVRKYSFWPPMYAFIKGELFDTYDMPSLDVDGNVVGVRL
jgi:hypothetical protein